MRSDSVMTQQELLNGYYKARCSVIHEFSGSIGKELWILYCQVRDYAATNGLIIPAQAISDHNDRWSGES